MGPGTAAAGSECSLVILLQGQPGTATLDGKRLPMLQDRTCREKVAFARRELPVLHGRSCREGGTAGTLGQLGVGLGLEPLDVHYETLMGPFADYSFGVPGDDLEHQAAPVDLDQF